MAFRLGDGFNLYDSNAALALYWDIASASWVPVQSGGRRTGCGYVYYDNGASNDPLTKILDAQSTLIMGYAYSPLRITSVSGSQILIGFNTSAGEQISLRCGSDGQLYISRNGTTLWTSGTDITYKLAENVFVYLEFKATIHGSTGSYSLRVNGLESTLVTASGVNTAGQGGTTADRTLMTTNGAWGGKFTDLYICDGTGSTHNDFLGDIRIDPLVPTADGTTLNFTNSTGGTSYNLVDETTPNSDTDYIYSSTVEHLTTLGVADMPYTPSLVYGVRVGSYSRKDDSGGRGLKNVIRTNATEYLGTEKALATSYALQADLWAVNPNTSALFTLAEVNALEIGVKVSS